jgi:1-acyl-sn-glycerol-3-phosphate acyltransferase
MAMHSEAPSQKLVEHSPDNAAVDGSSVAKSSTRRGPRIIGKLLFCWSWFVVGVLLLVMAPPVLLVALLAGRPDFVYPWADFGARAWLLLSGVRVKVTGRELLDPQQTYVFVSNHRSYFDAAPLFCDTGRRMGMVAKKELLKAPVLGYGMGFVNVIAIDRSNRERAVESLRVATERIRSGISFVVCPEGTRAPPGEMLPFKKGAFHMAIETGVPIVPVALKNSDNLMGKGTGEAWPGTIEMVILPPVDTKGLSTDEDLQILVNRVQSTIMKELGVKHLAQR